MGSFSKPQIKPLLSGKVELPENLQLDIMKYKFAKLCACRCAKLLQLNWRPASLAQDQVSESGES